MNFWLRVFATFFLSLILILVLPWWAVAVGGFLIGLTTRRGGAGAFFSGFFGIALLWWGYAGYIDVSTNSILTVRVADLLQLPSGLWLILITGIIGGLVGGFGALTGNLFRKVFSRSRSGYYR